ncbi:hypothetical protein ACFQT0_19620 [Hymenobacter humi]|uniref:HNH endonuclease n=1 Tax=Hymenobacter humi TaxID=1411620 RepID=A0ABW2UAI5_9BACT
MPVDYSKYHPDWPAISHQIRVERAGNRCEWCKAPNGENVARGQGHNANTYMLMDGQVFNATTGEPQGMARGSEYNVRKVVKIIITVAHLDHDEENHHAPLERLAALCQRCHLNYDRRDNIRRRFHKGQFALDL